jgi:hypothetical protein
MQNILISLLKNELVITLVFIMIGFGFSYALRKLKSYIEKTPNIIDDAIFNFLVNDIFLKVEKNKLENFIRVIPGLKNMDKAEKAIEIFKLVYKEQTGKNANEGLLVQAKAIWSELSLITPSVAESK